MPKPPAATLRFPASINRAIMRNWEARPEPKVVPLVGLVTVGGKGTVQKFAAAVLAIALFNRLPLASAGPHPEAHAGTGTFGYGSARMLVKDCKRAPETPERLMAPEVETEYCETTLPTSKVLAPPSVMHSEIGAPG